MPIWVDADACPKVIKEVLYRAADREEIMVTLVANQPLSVPPSARRWLLHWAMPSVTPMVIFNTSPGKLWQRSWR